MTYYYYKGEVQTKKTKYILQRQST